MECPYCNSVAILKDTSIIYGNSYGMAYICSNYPKCKSYVGVHRKSKKPLGTMANEELRTYRKKCHSLFDPLWKSGRMKRTQAYRYMSEIMNIPFKDAHIAMFDIDKCKKLIKLLNSQLNNNYPYSC